MIIIIILTALGMLTMFGGVFNFRKLLMPLITVGLLAAIGVAIYEWNNPLSIENKFPLMMRIDNYAIAFSVIALFTTLLLLFIFNNIYGATEVHLAEVYAILIFSLVGVVVMMSFTNLLMLFLGIEILSVALYVLAGLRKKDLRSNEAAMKYFLMGAFSTGFLLMGITLVYGVTTSFDLNTIRIFTETNHGAMPMMLMSGIILILVGLLFKVAAFPFQFWTPDVYESSPTIITAFMATVGKIASFAAFFRIMICFSSASENYHHVIYVVSILTMLIGNIIAIQQSSVKRMLAYSSIAHAGYMLMAIIAINNGTSVNTLLFYSAAYAFASVVSFSVVAIVQEKTDNDAHDAFNGIGKKSPLLGVIMTVAMLSLSGIPVTAGFFAKFFIFSAALQNGYVWLVVAGVISSAIGVYYYLRPVISMWFRDGEAEIKLDTTLKIIFVLLTVCTLVLGVLPGLLNGIL